MADRPYTVLSCGMSIDGYLDSPCATRVAMSNEADFDRVDAERASCDAILVGAATVRRDNPRLLVRSAARRRERVDSGRSPSPIKVTLTGTGHLDPSSNFFLAGDAERIIYAASPTADILRDRLGAAATVVNAGPSIGMREVSEDLHSRGVERLMVEGGGTVLTQFLTADLADELQLVLAPVFIGDSRASRVVHDGTFPWTPDRRATVAEARQIGDVVLITYALSSRFERVS